KNKNKAKKLKFGDKDYLIISPLALKARLTSGSEIASDSETDIPESFLYPGITLEDVVSTYNFPSTIAVLPVISRGIGTVRLFTFTTIQVPSSISIFSSQLLSGQMPTTSPFTLVSISVASP